MNSENPYLKLISYMKKQKEEIITKSIENNIDLNSNPTLLDLNAEIIKLKDLSNKWENTQII